MIGTSQLINTFSRPCFTDTTDIFKDGSGVALYGLDYDASDAGGASGKFGEAAIFNGSSSKIELPSALSDGSTTATGCISFWFNVGAEVTSSTQNNEIMQFAGTSSLTGKIALGSTSGHMSGETFSVTHNVSGVYTYSTTNIPAGWNHAVVQWNSSDGKWDIYINSVKHTTYTVGTNAQGYFKLKFGNRSSAYYTGSLDQIRIYTSALTQSQITQLYQENNSTVGTHLFGCIANYNLDGSAKESMGTTAYDGTETDIIYRYDGIPTAVDFGVGGQINYGARFNGNSSRIEVPNASKPSLSTATVSFWLKTSSTNTQGLVGEGYSGNYWGNLQIYLTSNKLYARSGNASSAEDVAWTSTSNVNTGNWVHCVVTISGNTSQIFINGTLETTKTLTVTRAATTNPFTIGQIYANGSLFGSWTNDCDIDQVRIFNKVLTSDEVSTLYAETACVYTATTTDNYYPLADGSSDAVAYYKLDNSAEDSVSTNDGTESNIEYRFGRYGQAAKFPALASSYINTGITSLGSDFSLSFWFNPDYIDGSAGYRAPLGKYWSGSGDGELLLAFYDNGNVAAYIYYGGGISNSVSHTHTTTVSNGNWYHYCLTWEDGVALKTYIDTVATTTTTSQTKNTNTVPLYIGALDGRAAGDSAFNAYAWSGFIDQVRIYSTALTSDQVTELYNEKPETDTSTFKTVLYEGNSSTQYISNVGMDLETNGGLVWIKSRDTGYHNRLFDSVRGLSTDGILYSNLNDAADNLPSTNDNFVSFDANGFTLGATSSTDNGSNKSGDDFVAWCWKAGGDAVSNTVGDITSQVSANDKGFSIVKYSGSTSPSNLLDSVGHGLNINGTATTPEMVIYKSTSGGGAPYFWEVWHKDLTNDNYYLQLNSTAAETLWTDIPNRGDKTGQFTSTTFPITYTSANGVSGIDYIAYCFASVSGYSKIGSYEGDSTITRPITTNFRPSIVIIKNVDTATTRWLMYYRTGDSDSYYNYLFAEDSLIEQGGTSSTLKLAISDTGFTVPAVSSSWINNTNDTHLYMAFK